MSTAPRPVEVAAAEPDGAPSRRRRRPALLAGAVAVLVVATAGTAVAFATDGQADRAASVDRRPPSSTQVTRQSLVDRETKNGELGYGTPRARDSRLSGTVTWLARGGATVKRGKALYRVDDEPVVLLYGGLPAYRTLRSGVSGNDVKQFERNLAALGYTGFTVDEDFTSATAAAVREWQEDLGLPETGQVDPARIVYAPGEVRVESHGVEVGDTVGAGKVVLSTTGTARQVTCTLDVEDQRLAVKGAKVTVTLPDGTRSTGKVDTVETVVQTSAASTGQDAQTETKIEVTVTGDDPKVLAGYDKAAVDVGFVASERADVLTVPVAALLTLAEGGYGLEVVEETGTRIVAVRTGLFADGRVEVSGEEVTEGLTVGMPGD
ncbi:MULTISPECIES: peptidoglycan-binding protein [Micromonospora]|uniref:Putative peptidoglycan binding domain-containing protein n=1 Tax=Micromonospora yangpuensis TaxID=683228 RepID=A0A1C6VD73_9ACTN|nr:peptidoglycan-binding protein [Micromonospora yangpuensis]GGM13637.1 peptidoglycan-binding protein [Micromonospora yangpuensis]SCL64288.1 Putative peptidoglycan binding domain-containing protein [Micromonospora yangpuensis]